MKSRIVEYLGADSLDIMGLGMALRKNLIYTLQKKQQKDINGKRYNKIY